MLEIVGVVGLVHEEDGNQCFDTADQPLEAQTTYLTNTLFLILMNSTEVDKLKTYIRKLKTLLSRIARENRGEPSKIDAAVALTNTI